MLAMKWLIGVASDVNLRNLYEFFLNEAELLLNSANAGNLINH